jgi:hypothetical protein
MTIRAEFYFNKETGEEIPCREFEKWVKKYGEQKAQGMVNTLTFPALQEGPNETRQEIQPFMGAPVTVRVDSA